MRLEKVTIVGFRCFGPQPVTIALAPELSAAIGPNAAGKAALLRAQSKLFGVSRAQRAVQRPDFHLAPGTDPDSRDPRDLVIDVLVGLPELVDRTATPEPIAPSFRLMRVERAGDAPVCRPRLDGRWKHDGTVEGEVPQDLFWVDTLEARSKDEQKHPVSAANRELIQLHYYTPASRDAEARVRATTGALAAPTARDRLVRPDQAGRGRCQRSALARLSRRQSSG